MLGQVRQEYVNTTSKFRSGVQKLTYTRNGIFQESSLYLTTGKTGKRNHCMDMLRRISWVGSSRIDLKKCPEAVQREIGYALQQVQLGGKPDNAKLLKGLGAGVMEMISRHDTNTYRSVYAVKVGELIYVLHCFQKKAKRGIKTPQQDIELIKQRLRLAKSHAKEYEGEIL